MDASDNTKKKRKKINPVYIIFILIGALGGFFGAGLIDTLEKTGLPSVLVILCIVAMVMVSFFLVTIIHEAGHLVMGLLTGYEFVSFRIGGFMLIKENGKLVRRKFNIAGTGGQCLLSYKTVSDPQEVPYFWYHFGGVFFNFLTAVSCCPFIFFAKNTFVMVAAALLALMSVTVGIINFIPTKATGVGTDGYNLLLMRRSPADRAALYKVLVINAMQYKGTKLEDIPKEIMTFSEEELSCVNGAVFKALEATLLACKHDFKAAEEKYRLIAEDENTYAVYKNEAKCEILFCMIMNGKTAEEIDSFCDKELKKYIELTEKNYISRKRLKYAYYLLVEKDSEKASAEYELAKKMENTYPAKGDYLSEMELIEYVGKFSKTT